MTFPIGKETRRGCLAKMINKYAWKILAGIGILFILILTVNRLPSPAFAPVEIYHYVLRDRIIVTDQVLMRKNLYIAYRLKEKLDIQGGIRTVGNLFVDGKLIAEANSKNTFEKSFHGGNVVFSLPDQIEGGPYIVQIRILNQKEELLAEGKAQLDRNELRSTFSANNYETEKPRREFIRENTSVEVQQENGADKIGYSIFLNSPLEYVFPESQQKKSDENLQISTKTVKNKFEPVTFLLFAYRDLGETRIKVGDLIGERGVISKKNIQVGLIESVEETYGIPEGKYLKVPTLIRPGNQFRIKKGDIQRIWITIRIDRGLIEGNYSGNILIEPEKGGKKAIPIKISVYPIVLEDIPGKDYFMLMTYEFTELTNPWGEEDRRKIYEAGCKILKNYREHGMTTLCFHSPFVLMTDEAGKPNLDDILAGLKAAKENGFERPII
jgi:hypothetical protein